MVFDPRYRAWRYLARVGSLLLPRNPAELLHTPKGTRRDQRVLSIDELITNLEALPLPDKLFISLEGISGLRPGEILALAWADVHEDGLHITGDIFESPPNPVTIGRTR